MMNIENTPLEFKNPCFTTLYCIGSPIVGACRIITNIFQSLYYLSASCCDDSHWENFKEHATQVLKGLCELIPILSGVAFTIYYYQTQQQQQIEPEEMDPINLPDAPENILKPKTPSGDAQSNQMRVDELVAFYTGDAKRKIGNKNGTFLELFGNEGSFAESQGRETIRPGLVTDEDLESDHSYVQWVFPTQTASRFNPDAPVLYEDTQAATIKLLNKNPRMSVRFPIAFERMMKFFQMEVHYDKENPLTMSYEGEGWPKWTLPAAGSGNHNILRMTRIMQSLHLFGRDEELDCLKKLLHSFVKKEEQWGRNNNFTTALKTYWAMPNEYIGFYKVVENTDGAELTPLFPKA